MRNYIFITLFVFLAMGCGKDKFQSKPDLKFKSVSTTELHREQLIRFTLEFTDKEGDISDSVFVQKVVPDCPATSFDQWYAMPVVPPSDNMKGEVVLTFGYNVTGYSDILGPQCNQDDNATFRFVLKDQKGNVSDTVNSPVITIFQ